MQFRLTLNAWEVLECERFGDIRLIGIPILVSSSHISSIFLFLYYSACKKATAMVFTWGDRGYPAICFRYNWPPSNIWLLRYKQNSFGCFWKNAEFHTPDFQYGEGKSKYVVIQISKWIEQHSLYDEGITTIIPFFPILLVSGCTIFVVKVLFCYPVIFLSRKR